MMVIIIMIMVMYVDIFIIVYVYYSIVYIDYGDNNNILRWKPFIIKSEVLIFLNF